MRVGRRDLGAVPAPERVERAVLVDALIGVRAEEVALTLHERGREPVGAQAVVVRQRRRERGGRDAGDRSGGDDASPGVLRAGDDAAEERGGDEGDESRVVGVRLGDPVEELGADDAAAAPDLRDLALLDVPAVLLGAGDDRVEALAVGEDVRRVQGLPHVLDEGDGIRDGTRTVRLEQLDRAIAKAIAAASRCKSRYAVVPLVLGVEEPCPALSRDGSVGNGNLNSVDSRSGGSLTQYTAKPYEVGLYAQDKMEFEGMIANVGLRLDVYNANVMYYSDVYAPYRYTDSLGVQRVDERYAEKSKTPVIARLQPRAGFSFPVSTETVFHVNYGTFLQRPPFVRIISQTVNRKELYSYGGALSVVGTLGNPRLRPEVTSSYDIGVTQSLGEGFTLDISGYYKDVRDLLQQAIYSSKQGNYVTYINRDYADIRGFRIGFARRRGMLTGTLNYTYGVATGKNSSSDGNQVPTIYESGLSRDPVPQDILLDFDRTHNLVANLGLNTPQEWGPVLFDAYPLERIPVAVTSFAAAAPWLFFPVVWTASLPAG